MDQVASTSRPLSTLVQYVVQVFVRREEQNNERKITVNPVVSKFASWYEKFRNAMEYREEEVILRATIERVLRRRLTLGGNAKTTAEPLVRELLWARYLPENSLPVTIIDKVEESIDLYLALRFQILQKHKLPEATINEWIYHLLSSDLENIIHPSPEKNIMANFMFQVLKEQIVIEDDTEETRNAQIYIGVRRSFARDDVAFLRYHLFSQYFGKLTYENVETVSANFVDGYKEIARQLTFPRREKIYAYIRKRTPPFLILEDVLRKNKEGIEPMLADTEALKQQVYAACESRYQTIASKVRRAIVRSVVFILLTKVAFAFLVEGTYERVFEGGINWTAITINTATPPILMILVGLFIRTPGEENTRRISEQIETLLYSDKPHLGSDFSMRRNPTKRRTLLNDVFVGLWFFAFILSFGGMIFVLSKLHFSPMSQFIFLFFLAIVSFLSYRISRIAHTYSVGERQGVVTPIVDFLFMPVVRVGRHLTQEISRFNFLLFIVDFFIETPFKVIFGFFEQWFLFLHSKREELE